MPRYSLISHPTQSNYVLDRMSLAADLFVDRRPDEAIGEVRSVADQMLMAFVAGVLVEGFSTLIAKSFNMTGRVAHTKRRLPALPD